MGVEVHHAQRLFLRSWERSPVPLHLLFFPTALACKHMDLKQLELDTAAAKVDELSKQLESLWTDHPGPPTVPSLVRRGRRRQGRPLGKGAPLSGSRLTWCTSEVLGGERGIILGNLQLCHGLSPGTYIFWCQAGLFFLGGG